MVRTNKTFEFMGILAEVAQRIEVSSGRETTVHALAKVLGISKSSAYYFEKSPGRMPVEVLIELQERAAKLGCPLSDVDFLDLVRSQVPRKERAALAPKLKKVRKS